MRRVIAIVLLLSAICLLAGCNREYTPDPAVREYLNNGMTAEKAYAQLATATYTETRTIQNKQGDVRGTFRSEVSIDKTDESNLGMTIHTVYDGDCIEDDNLIEMKATLAKTDGTYKYTVEKTFVGGASPSETVEEMTRDFTMAICTCCVFIVFLRNLFMWMRRKTCAYLMRECSSKITTTWRTLNCTNLPRSTGLDYLCTITKNISVSNPIMY